MPSQSDEDQAAAVIAKVTGGKPVRRDDGTASGVRDFDLIFGDGHAEPLEVTQATLPELNKAIAAHETRRMQLIQVPGLSQQWHVFSSSVTPFKTVTPARLARMLLPLESSAVDTFILPGNARSLPKVSVQEAQALGLIAAFAHGGQHGRVVLSRPSDDREWIGAFENPGQYALAAVEELAGKADNQRKLAVRGGADSHLFIWIDERNFLPWADLRSKLPSKAPTLPAEITNVWLATTVYDRIICWRYADARGWSSWEGTI
ncbi:MAG TPA: hypothetical protein DEV93_03615 [Chloroflexi bacterium]|jgi:hypothetical protein|nr:hypothetical protein [Chloroflexota bacterium]